MDLTKLSYEALHRYFTRLTQSGYIKYSTVELLLILLYIQELSKEQLTIEEQDIINKSLSCIQGNSCLIPYIGCNC